MSLFDFFLQEFGGGLEPDETSTTTDDTRRTAVTEAETDASSASVSATSTNRSGVLVEREDVTDPPPISAPLMEDLSDIASNELNSVSPTEDMSSAGIGGAAAAAARTTSDDTTISSVSMDDLSSLASVAHNEDHPVHYSPAEVTGAVIIESVPSEQHDAAENEQGPGQHRDTIRRWNRLRLPNLRSQLDVSDPHGQTIISSTPSEADNNEEDVDVPSSSAPSLSFNPSDIDSAVDTPSSLDSFSAISSMRSENSGEEEPDTVSEANLPKSPHSDPWPAEPTGHDRDVFSAVGNSLLFPSRDASSATRQECQTKDVEWWKYLSEKDWERLQAEARSILDSMEKSEEDVMASLPLPPPQPPTHILNNFSDLPSLRPDARRSIISTLPDEFICPICDDVIIGAVVVGCGCPRATCCFQCIEGDGSKPSAEPSPPEIEEIDEEEEEDYVMVEKSPGTMQSKHAMNDVQERPVKPTEMANQGRSTPCGKATCPSCSKADALIVPCHALDVAIHNSVSNLSRPTSTREDEANVQAFQHYYYLRLEAWRQELLRRRNLLEEERDHRRQKMLALLIETEEAALWSEKSQRRRQRQQKSGIWARYGDRQCIRERNGFGEIAFLAGAIAIATIIGVKLIRRC